MPTHYDQPDVLRFGLASSSDIRSWSFGEVKRPETINYKTYRPEKDGLFCERIFGPDRDWECSCGKYRGMKYKDIICDRCGIKVMHSRVRRERMGHIELAAPVVHVWFYTGAIKVIPLLLGMSPEELQDVLRYKLAVVLDPGSASRFGIHQGATLTDEEVAVFRRRCGESFRYDYGGRAIEARLLGLDLRELILKLRAEAAGTANQRRRKLIHRRRWVAEALHKGRAEPGQMVLRVLPVIPPDLRPLVLLDSGNFATSDLNDLYRRVINRNNRLKKLLDLNASEVIIRNEEWMLQMAVTQLLDNKQSSNPVVGSSKRPLKSLTDMITGKYGRFRENLLGKRVDYSGTCRAVPDPTLPFDTCGVPFVVAVELLQPFLIRHLKESGEADSIKSAKRQLETRPDLVREIVYQVAPRHVVLVQRFPTSGRGLLRGFRMTVTTDKAARLPLEAWQLLGNGPEDRHIQIHLILSREARSEFEQVLLPGHLGAGDVDSRPNLPLAPPLRAGVLGGSTAEAASDANLPVMTPAELELAASLGRLRREQLILAIPRPGGAQGRSRHRTTMDRALLYNLLGAPLVLDCESLPTALDEAMVAARSRMSPLEYRSLAHDLQRLALSRVRTSAVAEDRTPSVGGGSNVVRYFGACRATRQLALLRDRWMPRIHAVARELMAVMGVTRIVGEDCGDTDGVEVSARLLHRYAARTPQQFVGRNFLYWSEGDDEDPPRSVNWATLVELLCGAAPAKCRIRSPFTCRAADGVCRCCYGQILGESTPAHALVGTRCAFGLIEPLYTLARHLLPESQARLGDYSWYTPPAPRAGGVPAVDGLQWAAQLRTILRLLRGSTERAGAKLAPVEGEVCEVTQSAKLCYLSIRPERGPPVRVAFGRGRGVCVRVGQWVRQGERLTAGPRGVGDLAEHEPRLTTARTYFVRLYRLYTQLGVDLDPRHVELIAREQFGYCSVLDPGDSGLLPGATVSNSAADAATRIVTRLGGQQPRTVGRFLGTRDLLAQVSSPLVRAAYSRTKDTLIRAALTEEVDDLTHPLAAAMAGVRVRSPTPPPEPPDSPPLSSAPPDSGRS
jgi:hypothetical protein